MPLPTVQGTWILSPCNRIVYTSLVQVQRDFMFDVKEHLVANGYVVKGSSDGTTGAMDAVDRWITAANAGVRGANVTTAVSWIVLTSANGSDYLLSFVGATDDIYRISVSHLGTFVAAGTATHTPTSADEQILVNTTTIGATASADRVWTCWARDDAKGFRVAIARSSAWVGQIWGGEEYTKSTYTGGVTTSAEFGFGVVASSLSGSAWCNQNGVGASGVVYAARTSLGTNLTTCSIGMESFGGAGGAAGSLELNQSFAPELQGGTEFYLKRCSMFSVTSTMRGKLGNTDDWWMGRTTGAVAGDVYGNREFITFGSLVWPWDGTPSVAGTPVVMA